MEHNDLTLIENNNKYIGTYVHVGRYLYRAYILDYLHRRYLIISQCYIIKFQNQTLPGQVNNNKYVHTYTV